MDLAGPGQVTNSIDTTPAGSHLDDGGHIDTGGNGTRPGSGGAGDSTIDAGGGSRSGHGGGSGYLPEEPGVPTGDGHPDSPDGAGDNSTGSDQTQGPLANDPRYAHLPVENRQAIDMYQSKIEAELAKDDPRYYRVNQWNGDIFNHENYYRYEAKEVILERLDPETMEPMLTPKGNPQRPVLDSYTHGQEVVFRRQTQLGTGGVQSSTAIRYISEAANHYGPNRPDIIIADTPTTRAQLGHVPNAIGNPLRGQLIFEVPVQRFPIPREVFEHAILKEVTIRDVNGTVYRLEEGLP
jgi:hypothetical protein